MVELHAEGNEQVDPSVGGEPRLPVAITMAVVIVLPLLMPETFLPLPRWVAHRERQYPDLAFPHEMSPGIAPPSWRPMFLDYLYLGLTNNIAFSPTDVMPLALWAKGAMAVQSITSLLVLGLVIARAVNILQ